MDARGDRWTDGCRNVHSSLGSAVEADMSMKHVECTHAALQKMCSITLF